MSEGWKVINYLRSSATTTDLREKRNIRILASTFFGVGSKGVSVLTGLIMVPLTLHYLGDELYGLWLVISSFVAMLYVSDFGIGLGLLNKVAELYGQDDTENVKKYISSVFIGLTIFVILGGLIVFVLWQWIPFEWMFGIRTEETVVQLRPTLAVVFLIFMINLPLTLIEPIYQGYQEGYFAKIWLSLGNITTLFAVLIGTNLNASLPVLAFCLMGGVVIVNMASGIFLFWRKPNIRPSFAAFDFEAFKTVAAQGGWFFGIKIMSLFAVSIPPLIISHLLGPKEVTPYQISYKLVMIAPYLMGMYYISLWPAYREAAIRNDWKWIRFTFAQATKISLLVYVVVAGGLLVGGRTLIRWWVGDTVFINTSLLVGFTIWLACALFGGLISTFLNGLDQIKVQFFIGVPLAIGTFIFGYFFTQLWGAAGTIWGISIAFVLFNVVPSSLVSLRIMKTQIGMFDTTKPEDL